MEGTILSLNMTFGSDPPFLQPPPGGVPHGPPSGPPRGPPPLPTMEMDAYLDKDFFNVFEIIMNVVVINILSIVGSAGNVLCIYILSLHGVENSMNVTLVSLAVADLLILVTLPLRKLSLMIEPFDRALSITVESYIVRYNFLSFNRIWSLTSNAHVTLIAVERFLAVYFPFKVSRWVTTPRITVVVCFLHAIFYVMLIPMFAMFKIVWIFDPILNDTIAMPGITDFYLSREEQFNFYNSYIVNLFLGAVLLFITLICCIGICIKLVTLSKRRRFMTTPTVISNAQMTDVTSKTLSTTNASKSISEVSDFHASQNSVHVTYEEEGTNYVEPTTKSKQPTKSSETKSRQVDVKVVKLLLIVCFVYLVLIFPSFLLFVFQAIYAELREPYWRRVNFLATSVSMFLIALNSSLNFVIYLVNSQKFYGTFKQIFGCNKEGKAQCGIGKKVGSI